MHDSLWLLETNVEGVYGMEAIEVRAFDKPDETRAFEGKGWVDMITVAGRPVGCGHFEPGWKWSNNLKPIMKTDSCQVSHLGYCLEGRMRIHMDDGTEREMSAGELVAIPPGHDAEVVGTEPCVFLDFGDIGQYAQQH